MPKVPPSGEPTFREILISGLVEDKGDFHSSLEASDFKLKEVFQYICEPMLSIKATRRLGRPQRDSKRPMPLLVRFTSEWDARKSFMKAYKLKPYPVPLQFSKSLHRKSKQRDMNCLKNYIK